MKVKKQWGKNHVNKIGQTSACCLRSTKPWQGTGRIVIVDTWFESVNSAKELINKNGLYVIMLAKTAYRNYSKKTLREELLTAIG